MTDIAGFSTLEYLAHINASFSNEKLCEWTQNQRIEYKTLLDALEQPQDALLEFFFPITGSPVTVGVMVTV